MMTSPARKKIWRIDRPLRDRKSTRLNSSHQIISYAVFCLKKKKNNVTRAYSTALSAEEGILRFTITYEDDVDLRITSNSVMMIDACLKLTLHRFAYVDVA